MITAADDFETVSIHINDRNFDNWSEVTLEQSIDGFSSVGFTAPFEPTRKEFRDAFRPFTYNDVQVFVGADLAFTGTMIDVSPEVDPNSKNVTVTCYSKAAVLCDCTPDIKAPIEFKGMSLQAIASQIAALYGVNARVVSVDEAAADANFKKKVFLSPSGRKRRGTAFERVQMSMEDSPHDFLVALAKKRGLLLTDDEAGNILIVDAAPKGKPVASLVEGVPPLLSVRPQFSPQSYFSEMTGLVPAQNRKPGSHYTLPNPHMPKGVVRPHTFRLDSCQAADAPAAVRAKLGRMFGNMVCWTVTLPTWLDASGEHLQSNTTVTLRAPGAMVYRQTELLVRKCTRKQTKDSKTTELELVLPEAFGEDAIPIALPWDEAPQ